MTILGGVPPIISMGYWLAKEGANHQGWFNASSKLHKKIKAMMNGEAIASMNQEHQDGCYSFLKWLSVLILSFDGGVFSPQVRSFSDDNQGALIMWDNGIHERIQFSGWDRGTRSAINYIVKRASSIESFLTNIPAGLFSIGGYLNHNKDQLRTLIDYSATGIDHLEADVNRVFFALSASPESLLSMFYLELSEVIPDDLAFEGLAQPLLARQFFSKPVNDAGLLIDKVKMHYNLVNYASISPELKDALTKKTHDFLSALQSDPKAWAHVKDQIQVLKRDILTPRFSLVSVVLTMFWKN